MIKKGILFMMFLTLILMQVGCGKGKIRFGEAVPRNVSVVKLKEILKNSNEYKDKEVVLEGNYGNYCCASDFVYKEGVDAVEIYPKGFPTPKLERGKPIRVYGIVRSIEKKTESEEKEEREEHHDVYIEAKGVEVR